jgi:hypothetical protein
MVRISQQQAGRLGAVRQAKRERHTRNKAGGGWAFPMRFMVIDAGGSVKEKKTGQRVQKGSGATAQGGQTPGFARRRQL